MIELTQAERELACQRAVENMPKVRGFSVSLFDALVSCEQEKIRKEKEGKPRRFRFTFTCTLVGEGRTEDEARESIAEETDNLNQHIDEESAVEIEVRQDEAVINGTLIWVSYREALIANKKSV